MKKSLLLITASILLFACGKDQDDSATRTDKSLDNIYSHVFDVSAKAKKRYNIHNNTNCNNPNKKHKFLTQQQEAQKYQELCSKAAQIAERRLIKKCNNLKGTLENTKNTVSTRKLNHGFCKALQCRVQTSGSCGVN